MDHLRNAGSRAARAARAPAAEMKVVFMSNVKACELGTPWGASLVEGPPSSARSTRFTEAK